LQGDFQKLQGEPILLPVSFYNSFQDLGKSSTRPKEQGDFLVLQGSSREHYWYIAGTAAMNCEWWQGWRAGENIAIEYRGAEDQTERLPAFAAEFVRRELRSSLLWFAHGVAALGGNHDDPHRV